MEETYAKFYCKISNSVELSRMYFEKDPVVEVGSSEYGNGIFSLCDVKEGDLLTFYPAHYIIAKGRKEDTQITMEEEPIEKYEHTYSFQMNKMPFDLVGNPNKRDNPYMLGHLINDACEEVIKRPNEKLGDWAIRYCLQSDKRLNCKFYENLESGLVEVRAIRDIKQGEELYVTYGFTYWAIENNYLTPNHTIGEIMTRIHNDVGRKKMIFFMKTVKRQENY